MKKTIAIILCVFISLCFCACKESKTNENTSKESEATQNTASESNASVKVDYSQAVPAKQKNTVRYTESSLSVATEPIKNDAEMFEKSPVVLHGKVLEAKYLLKGSEVYTKSEVSVVECFKGNLKKGQVIKIREIGGFVPSDVFDNALALEKTGNEAKAEKSKQVIYDIRVKENKVMEKGEDVILFVYPIDYSDFEEFKTDSYQLVRAWQGKLLLDEKTGLYNPYVPSDELEYVEAKSYTSDEFDMFAKTCVKQ